MKRLTEKDSGKEIKLSLNEELLISLKENPTTGYVWRWKKESRILSLCRSQSQAPAGHQLGGVRKRDFVFVSRQPGKMFLNLFYLRPWKEEEPLKNFTLTVIIESESVT